MVTGGDRFAHDDAAYVLGLLPPRERAAFERHLADCPACRARVDALSGMPGLLATLRPEDADLLLAAHEPTADEPGDEPAAVAAAPDRHAGGRGIRRRVLATAAGLSAAAALLVALVITPGGGDGAPAPGHPGSSVVVAAARMTPIEASPVAAVADLVRQPWGTQIRLHCRLRHAEAAAGQQNAYHDWYTLVVHSRTGGVQVAGSWAVPYGRPTTFVSGTRLRPADISRIDIALPDGTDVLELRP